jgi:two-component system, OmpR family, alkaline phosphatase synthesis response regulator PhoP
MKKILLVEDEIPYIKLLRDQLTQNGFTVVEAKDGKEGLEMAKKEKPDLILLDIRMPTMDGMTMLSLLRKEESEKKTKVIILSNFEPDSKIISQVIKTKPTYFCIKSTIKLNDLISIIKEVAG